VVLNKFWKSLVVHLTFRNAPPTKGTRGYQSDAQDLVAFLVKELKWSRCGTLSVGNASYLWTLSVIILFNHEDSERLGTDF
jgi:hypothetical protein